MANDGIFTLKEFYNRGVIKMAPDALVYINGSMTSHVLLPIDGPNLSFNSGITAISVNNTLENPGSSTASIEINTPIYGSDSAYWIPYPESNADPNRPWSASDAPNRIPLFIPMMEVKIFFKGRFMVDGAPRYYLSFWGFITNVEENYSGGLYKILLSCADLLHWWSYSTINVHPTVESNIVAGGGQKLTVYSTIFETNNPFQAIYTLNHYMGMSSFVTPSWVAQKTPMEEIYPRGQFSPAVIQDIMTYWNYRFANTSNLLKMYGLEGQRVDQNGIEIVEPVSIRTNTSKNSEVQEARQVKDRAIYTINSNLLSNFSLFFEFSKMGNFTSSEYMTKRDIAIQIKDRCQYEFFQDVNGNFIFKPPFYNLNVKGIQPYTILPSDIINCSFRVEAEGIVTAMTVSGSFAMNMFDEPFGRGIGFHMDIDLAKKFGVRPGNIHIDYVTDPHVCRTLALGLMVQTNAKTVTGSITIPGRPEMRLGYPIYIEHRDSFHYVKTINHSFSYGGSFTTTLGLETERRKMYLPDKNNGNKFMLQRDKVYRLSTKDIPPPALVQSDQVPAPPSILSFSKENLEAQNVISITQGGYEIDDRRSPSEMVVTHTTVPFTDEEGYRVIGSFLYGRNVNALCIDSKTIDTHINPFDVKMKDVYLTTMARPTWRSESDVMNPLFFEDQEGAVPTYYLNLKGEDGNSMPVVLGNIQDIDETEKVQQEEDIIAVNNAKPDSSLRSDQKDLNVSTKQNLPIQRIMEGTFRLHPSQQAQLIP